MSRGSWMIFLSGGLFAGLVSVSMALGLLFAWLTVWPIAWLAEWIRGKWAASVILGYFASVGIRVVVGMSLAIALDALLNQELGANRVYWFGWLANYIVALIIEMLLVLNSNGRTGDGIA